MIYAINRQTKEHRVVTSNGLVCEKEWYTAHGWLLRQADADGWIPWEGGECPLPDDARIKVMTRNGVEHRLPIHAGNQRWGHGGGQYDIIAYRLILNTEPGGGEGRRGGGRMMCM